MMRIIFPGWRGTMENKKLKQSSVELIMESYIHPRILQGIDKSEHSGIIIR